MKKLYEYKEFEVLDHRTGITVYSETKEHAELWGTKQKTPTINWACYGAVSIEQAEEFLKKLKQAIFYAKQKKRQ